MYVFTTMRRQVKCCNEVDRERSDVMKRKNSQGTMLILFNTDLEKASQMDESKLTPLQKQCFSRLSEKEQIEIRKGNGAAIVDLESGGTICDFNMENYQPPQSAIESLARSLLPSIQEYYSSEESRCKFEESKVKHNKD